DRIWRTGPAREVSGQCLHARLGHGQSLSPHCANPRDALSAWPGRRHAVPCPGRVSGCHQRGDTTAVNREIIMNALFNKLTTPPLLVTFTADTTTGDVALTNVSDMT